MEKDRKAFKDTQANLLAEALHNPAKLENLKPIFMDNVRIGSKVYIEPLVDVVKNTIKKKETAQIKFTALMLLKEAMDLRHKEIAKYTSKKILSRLKEIAKMTLKTDKNKLFTNSTGADDFYRLLLECFYHWQIYFQIEPDTKMDPSLFKKAYSELLEAGVRFPSTYTYFQVTKKEKSQESPKQQKSQKQPNQPQQQQQQQLQQQQQQQPATTKPQIKQQQHQQELKQQAQTILEYAKTIHSAITNYLQLVLDSISQNDCTADLILEFQEDLERLKAQITEDMINQLVSDEGNVPYNEQLVADIYALSEVTGDVLTDLTKLRKNNNLFTTFKRKYMKNLKQSLEQVGLTPEQVNQYQQPQPQQQQQTQSSQQPQQQPYPYVEQTKQLVEEPKKISPLQQTKQDIPSQKYIEQPAQEKEQKLPDFQQEQKQYQESPDYNPFVFTQVANFNVDPEPEIYQPVVPQKIQPQFQEQPPQKIVQQVVQNFDEKRQISEESESQRKNQPETNPFEKQQSQLEWGGNQWDNTKPPPELETAGNVQPKTNPFDRSQTQSEWGGNQWDNTKPPPGWDNSEIQTIKAEPQDLEVEPPQWNAAGWKEEPVATDWDKQAGWGAETWGQEEQPKQQTQDQWNPTPVAKLEKQQSEEEGFNQFSKVFNNQSDFKTAGEQDNKPFSNIFGFGDPSQYENEINLKNYAESSKMSQKNRSNSVESQVDFNMFPEQNQFIEPTIHSKNDFQSQQDIKSHNEFEFPAIDKFQNIDDFPGKDRFPAMDQFEISNPMAVTPTNNRIATNDDDDFVDPYNTEDQTKKYYWKKKPEILKIIDPVINRKENSRNYQPNLSLVKLIDISILSYSKHKVSVGIQAAEQKVVAMKYNPQQEQNHQNEKIKLNQQIQQLLEQNQELKTKNSELTKENKQFDEQFTIYKQFEKTMSDSFKKICSQYSALSIQFKDLKDAHQIQCEEILKLQQENQELSQNLSNAIRDNGEQKIYEDSLLNKLKQLENQFKKLQFDHKCPIQSFVQHFFKVPTNNNTTIVPVPQRISIQKIQKFDLVYDSSLFIHILRGCAQPFSNQIDDLKYAMLQNRAVLYEDRFLQIGVITKSGSELSVQLHILNRGTNDLVISKIRLVNPSNNLLNNPQVPENSVLQRRSNFKILLKFQFQELMQQPILEFSANEHTYQILLPVEVNKFMSQDISDALSLSEKWKDNTENKVKIRTFIEQPNHKLIGQLADFKRYFPQLVELNNSLVMHTHIDNRVEIGIKFKIIDSKFAIKLQSSQFWKHEAENIAQFLLFVFNK